MYTQYMYNINNPNYIQLYDSHNLITPVLKFVGYKLPDNPQNGDFFINKDTEEYIIYYNGEQITLSYNQENNKINIEKIVTVTHCPCCGAPVKENQNICNYCGVLYPTEYIKLKEI